MAGRVGGKDLAGRWLKDTVVCYHAIVVLKMHCLRATQDAELIKRTEYPTEPKDTLIKKFMERKSGWRRKPVTAKKQAKQLRSVFDKVTEVTGERRPDIFLRSHADQIEKVLHADLPGHTALVKSKVPSGAYKVR